MITMFDEGTFADLYDIAYEAARTAALAARAMGKINVNAVAESAAMKAASNAGYTFAEYKAMIADVDAVRFAIEDAAELRRLRISLGL